MKETNYWQQFLQTGHIADYLQYCAGEKQERPGQDRDERESSRFLSRTSDGPETGRMQEGTGYAGRVHGDGAGVKG